MKSMSDRRGHSPPKREKVLRLFSPRGKIRGDNRDGAIFRGLEGTTSNRTAVPFIHTATITRKAVISSEEAAAGSEKSSEKILGLLRADPKLAARAIAEELGISPRAVEKQIARLREEGRIQRVGPDKGGHWEVVE